MSTDDTSFDDLYPGRYLKAGNLHAPTTFTIERVYSDLELQKLSKKKTPPVVFTLREVAKEIVACKTVGICLREMFGDRSSSWIGKRVTFFSGRVEIPGKFHGQSAVRVYGSPELEADRSIVVAFAGKPPFTVVLHATGQRPAATQTQGGNAPAAQQEQRAQRSEHATAYIQKMAGAKVLADLASIEEALTEDNRLSSEETQQLAKLLVKRQGQLAPPAA